MRTIKNVDTADTYTTAATVESKQGRRLIFYVVGAGVFAQFQNRAGMDYEYGAYAWSEPETFIPPQGRMMEGCAGVRFRSALAGVSAQVSAELFEDFDPQPSALTLFAPGAAYDPTLDAPAWASVMKLFLVTLAGQGINAGATHTATIPASGYMAPLYSGEALLHLWADRGFYDVELGRAAGLESYKWMGVTGTLHEPVVLPELDSPTVWELRVENPCNYAINLSGSLALVGPAGGGLLAAAAIPGGSAHTQG